MISIYSNHRSNVKIISCEIYACVHESILVYVLGNLKNDITLICIAGMCLQCIANQHTSTSKTSAILANLEI